MQLISHCECRRRRRRSFHLECATRRARAAAARAHILMISRPSTAVRVRAPRTFCVTLNCEHTRARARRCFSLAECRSTSTADRSHEQQRLMFTGAKAAKLDGGRFCTSYARQRRHLCRHTRTHARGPGGIFSDESSRLRIVKGGRLR